MRQAILVLFGVALMAQPASAEIGRVKRMMGNASIERGKAMMPGDKLVTGRDGQMSVTFIDDTRFAVGPNSQVSVDQFDYNRKTQTGAFLTKVNRGSLAVVSGQIAHSKQDAMKVRTPTSLLGVRGTRFIVEVPK